MLGDGRTGNMTTIPQPGNLTSTYTATYDAWNRMVKVEDGSDDVASYEYDGMNRRIEETVDTDGDGTLDETRHVYYSSQWQRLEVRVGGTASGDVRKHWLWGSRYTDALIQRKRDTGTDGSFDQTHYALQDANFRVTAITDASGSVVERYTYTPYGERTILNGANDADGNEWTEDTNGSDVDMRIGHQGFPWRRGCQARGLGDLSMRSSAFGG